MPASARRPPFTAEEIDEFADAVGRCPTALIEPPSEVVAGPHAALQRARELAGSTGMVLASGSIYLVADLLAPEGQRRASML